MGGAGAPRQELWAPGGGSFRVGVALGDGYPSPSSINSGDSCSHSKGLWIKVRGAPGVTSGTYWLHGKSLEPQES